MKCLNPAWSSRFDRNSFFRFDKSSDHLNKYVRKRHKNSEILVLKKKKTHNKSYWQVRRKINTFVWKHPTGFNNSSKSESAIGSTTFTCITSHLTSESISTFRLLLYNIGWKFHHFRRKQFPIAILLIKRKLIWKLSL